jgi:hypothetical protein
MVTPDAGSPAAAAATKKAFRFFDNREKYLMFVTTCSEKWAVAKRVGRELPALKPTPPALNVFDAGMGDGTVLMHVLRDLHQRFPTVPFRVVGKEISMEDARLTLEKLPDRFNEHPQTIFCCTNMYYAEAPWFAPAKPEALKALRHWEIALEGTTAHEFDEQIRALLPLLAEGWQTRTSARTGNPLYVTPSLLTLYRADQRFALSGAVPRPGAPPPGYDLVMASQPYRARLSAETKVRTVLGPLARALAPGGRLVVIQSTGRDPGLEIIRAIWPDENPFRTPRLALIDEMRRVLSADGTPALDYRGLDDDRSLFRYDLHAMPDELGESIGTSTLLAAWNAAVYVAQIEDDRLVEAMSGGAYLDATRAILRKHGGLWFEDESFVVTRPA